MERIRRGLGLDLEDEEKQGDPHERIFDGESTRRELHRQRSQLSPRRQSDAAAGDLLTTTTLPFYQDISPTKALERLFDWFSTGIAADAASGEGGNDREPGRSAKTITRDDFNQLRKCIGRPIVSDRDWERAMEELGLETSAEAVSWQNFKALFGPPPFFGSTDVQNVVHEVMKAEEFLHFAGILVSRFGVESASSSTGPDSNKVIGHEQLQEMQRASSANSVFEQSEWLELCKKVLPPDAAPLLTWLQFSEAFSVSVGGKRVCAPHKDPPAVVYACLASDKVMETIKDADDDQVSQKAFTNLLRVQREKVDDAVWLDLLQNMQTTYKYRQQKLRRKSSFTEGGPDNAERGHGYEQPLVVVRNTRNQVLSYEIVFDELGDIGLKLQSDFRGQCVTVAEAVDQKADVQAARHSIIQPHDIVAAVNGINLTHDTMALDSAKAEKRLEKAKKLLNANTARKVTFLRQESYYQYSAEEQVLYLYLKTIERVPQDGMLHIHLPAGSYWKPNTFDPEDDTSSLEVDFEVPRHSDFEQAMVSWKDDAQVIEIVLDGETAIGENSTLVLKVAGINCGDQIALGPCELSTGDASVAKDGEQAPACIVSLYSNWHTREGALGNPIRDRVRRAGEYFDSSLKPLGKDFQRGDPGLTLESDFFGQCPVVTKVRPSSPGEILGVLPHDILASITSVGGDKTLNQLNCIKPFSMSKPDAEAHIREVRKQLAACHATDRPYHLEFLRLKSYFFHENGRTVFTFHAPTSLREGASLLVKLPSTKWRVSGLLTAHVMDPSGVKVREIVWDSQQHAVHLTLDLCSIPESAIIVVEILGVEPPSKAKGIFGGSKETRCAGPGEVVGVFASTGEGDESPPEMEFILHENWHSFIVGHQGIEATKINETLKKFKTTPAALWEVLEYTSLLFEMCKSPNSENLSFPDMNRLIGLVCGDQEAMDLPKWNVLCRALGATPLAGLTRRQFACCWYDVTGLTSHSAKDVYLRIQTARKLFAEIIAVFQANDVSDVITKETISKLASIGGFSETKALKSLEEESRPGWEVDLFCQIVCGGNRGFQFEDNPMNLWIKMFYAKKLFKVFSDFKAKRARRRRDAEGGDELADVYMRKKSFVELFAAAKITKPKLSNDVWTKVCDSVELDETSGFSFDKFLEVYSREPLGPRDALADYYRIETFKMLPERRVKPQEATKEAALNVAPEKVDVKNIAAEALKDTASAEEVFEDLLKQGLEFSKQQKIQEIDDGVEIAFESKFAGKRRSRSKGFFHLKVGGISELADHVVTTDRDFNKDKKPEELYVTFEITDEDGLKKRMPKATKKGCGSAVVVSLFGGSDAENVYVVQPDEMWDHGVTQDLMREMNEIEIRLKSLTSGTPDYDTAFAKLSALMAQLTPSEPEGTRDNAFNGRIFSSKLVRNPSPDAVVHFHGDHFRLFLDTDKGESRKLLVCKLFKSIGSEIHLSVLDLQYAEDAHATAERTYTILQDLVAQQEIHLRYVVADRHKTGTKNEDDRHIWATLSKLQQKREDLVEFKTEVEKREAAVARAKTALGVAETKMKKEQEIRDAQQLSSDATSAPGVDSQKPGKAVVVDAAPDVRLIGYAFFDVKNLLDVLHEDKDTTSDVTHFLTVKHKDIGLLLLEFEYKCENLQRETPCEPLPSEKISLSGNVESTRVEKITEEIAFTYPPHSHLELTWKSNQLQKGDRLVLVRDGDKSKLSQPFFMLLWIPYGSGGENDELCDWTVPEVLKKSYSVPGEVLVNTDPSKTHGTFQLPSSIGLSLPPGVYKLYLIRNGTDAAGNNFRKIIARTPALMVLPGINSVHTPFGTTPLIDVKTMFATLQVFAEEDQHVVADALKNQDGFFDQYYRDRITNEQEIEVTKREIKAAEGAREKAKDKKKFFEEAEKKIEGLRRTLKLLVAERKRLRAEQPPRPKADKAARARRSTDGVTIARDQEVVFSYRFHGGKPHSQDVIEILPADVVLASDNLRSLILGKLQGNNPEQVKRVRETIEAELMEVAQFFSLNICERVWKLARKVICGIKDSVFSATGDQANDAFVWNECMKALKTASPIARKSFPYIVLDLLDEIAARGPHLGITTVIALNESTRTKLNSVFRVSLTIPVLVAGEASERSGQFEAAANGVIVGQCKTSLKNCLRQGGHYIAKYVRRTDAIAADKSLVEDAGEICRFGPFYIEPAEFSFSAPEMYLKLKKLMKKFVMSEQVKLGYKCFGHVIVSFLKYFLGVVNLSFNVNVLAGNFSIDTTKLEEIMNSFKARMLYYYGPIKKGLEIIYNFFNGYIQQLMDELDIFNVADECIAGFYLYGAFALLFAATFVVYVVVQEDLLLKVQKLHTYLPINPGKSMVGFLEQIGSLLVIPLYLTIKSCVLFISGAWLKFYDLLQLKAGLSVFKLYRTADSVCTSDSLAKINYGFGIVALVLIVMFLFVCLPLLLLDLYSWVPLSELEKPEKLHELAHSFDRVSIKAAVHSNASLVECGTSCRCSARLRCCCKLPRFLRFRGFRVYYYDYTTLPSLELLRKYGILGLVTMFTYVYINLMFQSMARSLGVLVLWRPRAPEMYKNKSAQPVSSWKFYDRFCLRFNLAWKVQYIKDKIVMPFVNIVLVTLGLWGEDQWKEFNVEDRANQCYLMEPSAEIKQLQMMSLHGKITSLFWLCIPKTMVLAYLAEVLNRGPVFSYFLNKKFLQADIPESERERDPVWRFSALSKFQGEEDVVYLTDTRFYSTTIKWGSSLVEIIMLVMVFPSAQAIRSQLLGVALISAAVSPVLEFNQQVIKAYIEYKESVEHFITKNDMFAKLSKASDKIGKAQETFKKAQEPIKSGVDFNLPGGAKPDGDALSGAAPTAPEATGAISDGDVTLSDGNKLAGSQLGSDESKPDPPGSSDSTAKPTATDADAKADDKAKSKATSKDSNKAKAAPKDGAGKSKDGAGKSKDGAGKPKSAKKKSKARPATAVSKAKAAASKAMAVGTGAATALAATSGGKKEGGGGGGDGGGAGRFADPDELIKDVVEEGKELADDVGGVFGEEGAAAMFAAAGMIKPKKELIVLNALPEISYVVLTDDLDEGEGEITVNWQINAKQRFHALDAIGMFPAGGSKKKRSMDDCICYCLLKQRSVTRFGWKANAENTEDAENTLMVLQAKSLRDVTEKSIRKIKTNAFSTDGEQSEEKEKEHTEMLALAAETMKTMLHSPKLKPYAKKMSDMLEEEVEEHKLVNVSRKATRMLSNAALSAEEAAKKARKVIAGQVKFRPTNSNTEDEDLRETFSFGNNAGIYQSKYGLQKYEFCYLRHADVEAQQVGLSEDKAKADAKQQQQPLVEEQSEHYEILDRFSSNEISIGTFNLFMTLTCDIPLVGANETVNLSWMIYGVPYSILSNAKSRNCVAFYKAEGCGGCSKIEIIPTSAYLEVPDHERCPGRMLAVAPKEPGVYEIRFLFNFFKKAQLHRQCQVFGELEDQMYQLRIRSFFEKRTLTEEVQRFATREPRLWGVARMNTFAWLKSMLLSTFREPVKSAVVEMTSEYSAFLYGRLQSKLTQGMKTNSKVYQARLRKMIAPLNCKGFMSVLVAALASNSQMNDHLASIGFISPTDEDVKNEGLDPLRDSLLLPKDKELLKIGPSGFRLIAKNYLSRVSLCGYHDFVDDIVLNQVQIQDAVDQVMNNLASTCVAMYESSIQSAATELMKEVHRLGKENAMQGIDATLVDLCRNHIQSIVRAFVETDCRTGMRWKGPPPGTSERLAALRRGSLRGITSIVEADRPVNAGECVPVTREHLAVRKWIRPRLERKIVSILRQRHARLLEGNMEIVLDLLPLLPICCGRSLSLVGNPFPSYQSNSDKSALYFLEESRGRGQQSATEAGEQQDAAGDDDEMEDEYEEQDEDKVDDEEEKEDEDEDEEEEEEDEDEEDEDEEDEGEGQDGDGALAE